MPPPKQDGWASATEEAFNVQCSRARRAESVERRRSFDLSVFGFFINKTINKIYGELILVEPAQQQGFV